MQKGIIVLSFIIGIAACKEHAPSNYSGFETYPVYEGTDLWTKYTPEYTLFKIWSPTAEEVKINIYEKGHRDNFLEEHFMKRRDHGTWEYKLKGDYLRKYYTYQVKINGEFLKETPGIYAQAVGVNGNRAMIIDLESTNPEGWHEHKRPELDSPNDIILYELHVRDITSHANSGSEYPGKFWGLMTEGTKSPAGLMTGIDHIKELGITHVHLLPSFDYRTVDEERHLEKHFNWGYDPQNFNVPEGSYSIDPWNAQVRIREFKEMVKKFHENGIRVILDVVYNHTGETENSNFNLEVPGYYYRLNVDSSWSNASGCGNETASERPMMRKFIIESCKYWIQEYKIDGFRFDLMGIHDTETLNLLSEELKKIDHTLFVYGEGWTAGGSPLADSLRALKVNANSLTDAATFSDDIRDGIKGSVFDEKGKGFVNGGKNFEETIKFGIVGSTEHPQIDIDKVHSTNVFWANKPSQSIGYVSCHDNNTLYDKLILSAGNTTEEEIKKMHCLSNAIVLTSQSIPFLHAGVEMMRTKGGEHNSYNLPDEVNQINWDWKEKNYDVFEYYKGLIKLRKAHPAFRMPSTDMVQKHLEFFDMEEPGIVAFRISDNANIDTWEEIIVIYNSNKESFEFELPEDQWSIAVEGMNISLDGLKDVSGTAKVPAISMMVLFR